MPDRPHHGVIQYLRRIVGREEAIHVSDGQLLGRFVTQHDEAVFELLVRRHGKMVLAVCRRLIHDERAAEDAFQAAFLVLARGGPHPSTNAHRWAAGCTSWTSRVFYWDSR